MSLIASNMLPLGSALPAFNLPDTHSGQTYSDQQFAGQPLLVAFICNHCPYVVHIQDCLAQLFNTLQAEGLGVVAISANDARTYPQDGPEKMAAQARLHGYRFPYLYDQSQAVARAFDAACTPDFYLFDAAHTLVYRGQFDDARVGNNVPVTGGDVARAARAQLRGEPIDPEQKPSIGCSIKWRS